MAQGGDVIVRFENVTFEYGHNKPILEEVSFPVRRGGKLALMGQNGAGKSTLFGLITGTLSPEDGNVHIARGVSPSAHFLRNVLKTKSTTLTRALTRCLRWLI
jgi:ABC-type Mn2+/Zn2+ transport system ATPase subunit